LAFAIHSGDLAVLGEFSDIREYVLKPLPGAGSARRVRARSFRVRAFAHLIAREIRRRCDSSGDSFADVSISGDSASRFGGEPIVLAGRAQEGAERALTAYQAELDRWSLTELGGELVFHLAAVRCSAAEIPYAALQERLAHRLLRPLEGALVAGARWNSSAFRSGWGDPHAKVCAGCGATAGDVSAEFLCDSCIDDDELGKLLPACNFGHWVDPDHATVHVPGQGLALSTATLAMAGPDDLDLTTSDWAILRHLPHGDFQAMAERSAGHRKMLAYLAIGVETVAVEDVAAVEPAPVAVPVAEQDHAEAPAEVSAAETDTSALDSAPPAESEETMVAAAPPAVSPEPPAKAAAAPPPDSAAPNSPPPDSVAAHAYSLILARFPDVYPILGDRDTLLAGGPWDQVLRLALQLRHDFRNSVREDGGRLAFFAGLALEHPQANLPSAVDHARTELARAQSNNPDGGSIPGCVSVFGQVLDWKAAKDVADRGFEMATWLKEDRMSSSALRRIGELHRLSQGNQSTPGANHWKLRYLPLLIWQARDADRLLRRKILRLAADPELWKNTGLVTELAFLAAPVRARGLGLPAKAGGDLDG
jgi:hypothetical protein